MKEITAATKVEVATQHRQRRHATKGIGNMASTLMDEDQGAWLPFLFTTGHITSQTGWLLNVPLSPTTLLPHRHESAQVAGQYHVSRCNLCGPLPAHGIRGSHQNSTGRWPGRHTSPSLRCWPLLMNAWDVSSLRGPALEVLAHLTPAQRTIYPNVVGELERLLGHHLQAEVYWTHLKGRVREAGEPLFLLAQDMKRQYPGPLRRW